ncbi:hypothetical protein TWF718_003384 [Orbilia javanica]|uniref:Uncharacterized protein n=1 Tax=Orbilia javanica TaxID=47235 RepID=A0AAN8MEK9_9PEZI
MSTRTSSSTSKDEKTFTVNLTPEFPGHDTHPNLTYFGIAADDFLSKITRNFESYKASSELLPEGYAWRYYRGSDHKELKTRYTFRKNGMLPGEEWGRYVDIIARPGLERWKGGGGGVV